MTTKKRHYTAKKIVTKEEIKNVIAKGKISKGTNLNGIYDRNKHNYDTYVSSGRNHFSWISLQLQLYP